MLRNSFSDSSGLLALAAQRRWVGRNFNQRTKEPNDGNVPETTPHAPPLRAGTRCVRGNYRTTNEDKCFADVVHGLFLVSDGMGGYEGGAEASRIVLQVLPNRLRTLLESPDFTPAQLQSTLLDALNVARKEMAAHAAANPGCYHMGATMALAVVHDRAAYVARVGDCRVYLARGDKVVRLTSDETFAQELNNVGVLTEEELRKSEFRHIVTNSLSIQPLKYEPQLKAVPLQPADRLILLTDGATDSLDDDSICAAAKCGCPDEAADTLVLEALRQGSRDNVSCVVVKVVPECVHWHQRP